MFCKKCGEKNAPTDNFCSACGENFKSSSSPAWLKFLVAIMLCVTAGAAYFVYDLYQDLQANNANSSNVSTTQLGEPAEVEGNEEVVKQTEQPVQQAAIPVEKLNTKDRVTLIKDVQQKVFTILTSYGHGSGFLYAKGGYVVTNAHVVEGEVEVTVRNSNGQEYPAKVIGISDSYDIALLQVPDYANLEPLPMEHNESEIGLEVVAFGSPQGFENSASPGYITGHNRDLEVDRFIYKQIYQVDAQIDKGSSGGPLVDVSTGKVIGINSLLYTSDTSTTFGFSIPLYSMKQHFDQWIKQPMSREKVLAVAGIYESYYDYDYSDEFYEESDVDSMLAGQFVQSFRMYYEQALNENEFYWVADMLTSDAYNELEDYIADVGQNGHVFSFIENNILGVIYEDGAYYVDMNEKFNFYSSSGEDEYFDRYKTYTVITDEYGAFKIANIAIHQ